MADLIPVSVHQVEEMNDSKTMVELFCFLVEPTAKIPHAPSKRLSPTFENVDENIDGLTLR